MMNYEDQVKKNAGSMIEKLVKELPGKKAVDIRFEFEENEQWSIVSVHMEEEDQEMALRLHHDDKFELYFGYYDKEDEFHEIIHELSAEEKKIIPKALQKIMGKVLDDEEGLRVPGALLVK